MKNIPVFTAVNGTASVILQEIPYSGKAYILIRSVWTTAAALLEECCQFCRMAGAEQVFTCEKAALPQPRRPVVLEPLTPENGGDYLAVYNRCFREVPGAATYGQRDLKRLYDTDCAFLVRQDGVCAAVAEICEEGLEGIAVLPEFRGLGYDLAAEVLQMVPSVTVRLKVASTNERAIALYERLGFVRETVVSRWWKI